MSSAWSNSYVGRFLSVFNSKMERRKLNYMSFTTLFSIASFKFLTCSFIFLVAHLVLLNIVMLLLFGHHENYDLITQKELFSCVAIHKKHMNVFIKKAKPYLTSTSSHGTKSYNCKGGHKIESNIAPNNGIYINI